MARSTQSLPMDSRAARRTPASRHRFCSSFTSQNGEKNHEVEFAQSLAVGRDNHACWLYDEHDRISPHAIGS
jgi:hypothetical protein